MFFILIGLALLSMGTQKALAAGVFDTGFNVDLGGGYVTATAIQPDGKILLGGSFTTVNGQSRTRVARLNSDGTLEGMASFNIGTGADGPVNWITVQPDGQIVIGGRFGKVNGRTCVGVARLNSDGSVESSATFNSPTNIDYPLWAMVVQPDGKILLGGDFHSINGQPRFHLARLNVDGSLEGTNTFNLGSGPENPVASLAVQDDGKIVLGGAFRTYNGQSRNWLARINSDGTLESTNTFNAGSGPDSFVWTVSVQPDGKILIGGGFFNVNGQRRGRIARLNPDGSLESTNTFNLGGGANDVVYSLVTQADGKIIVTGQFSSIDGQPRHRVARLNADGSLESIASFDAGEGPNNIVYGASVQSDGKILLGGIFDGVNGIPTSSIARLDNDPATELLAVIDRFRVNWSRTGSAPEIQHVSFQLSTNGGGSWKSLGPGTRVSGGWEISGLALPSTGLVRAGGRTSGGSGNNSSGFVESTIPYAFSASEISGQVQLQEFAGNSRTVTFVATGGVSNKIWHLDLEFVDGIASYRLPDFPPETTSLSAKTPWNLRSKRNLEKNPDGSYAADFVDVAGSNHVLRGGDLSGNNIVNLQDYSLLGTRFYTFDLSADITGDSQVDYDDYYLVALNWFTAGDPE